MERVSPTVRTFFGNTINDNYYNSDEDKFYNNPEVAFYDSSVVVQRAGYKPVRLQVKDFINAGERLSINRKMVYFQTEFEKLKNNDLELPVYARKTDFDLNDAFRLEKQYKVKIDEYNKLVEERKNLERLENEKLFKDFTEWKKSQQISNPKQNDTGNASA